MVRDTSETVRTAIERALAAAEIAEPIAGGKR
jgi:hypothetical protein